MVNTLPEYSAIKSYKLDIRLCMLPFVQLAFRVVMGFAEDDLAVFAHRKVIQARIDFLSLWYSNMDWR